MIHDAMLFLCGCWTGAIVLAAWLCICTAGEPQR